jgi:hypothetical protein
MQQLGTLLARLGGADIGVLDQARKERSRYIAMAIVLLSTAFLAVLSMTFAMTDGLHVQNPGAVLVGLAWGAVILNLDRLLILSLKPRAGAWRMIAMILPRILMAALLGLVIATPLTLRIFQPEIKAQMVADNIARAEQSTGTLNKGTQQAKLDQLNSQIKHYEDILAGNVTYTSPNLEQAQKELDQAQADKKAKETAYEQAYDAWRCELDGDRCNGASGKHGDGPRAKSLKVRVDLAQADLRAASDLVDQKQAALNAQQGANKTDSDAKLAGAQAEANRVLPGLRKQRDDLQQAIAQQIGNVGTTAAKDDGLLAQLVALDHLGNDNGWARLAHLLVAGLFFMVELLPVAVKSLTILGPPTLYDQINDLDDKRVLEDAAQNRSLVRRRRKRGEDKAIELDEDMYTREIALGKEANKRVADTMEKILDDALDNWSRQVTQLLHAQNQQNQPGMAAPVQPPVHPPNGGQAPQGQPPNGASGIPGQRGGTRRLLHAVIGKLNLPPSRKHQP